MGKLKNCLLGSAFPATSHLMLRHVAIAPFPYFSARLSGRAAGQCWPLPSQLLASLFWSRSLIRCAWDKDGLDCWASMAITIYC